MKVMTITFERCQLGWRCRVGFMVTTAGQFTDIYETAVDGGLWKWLAYWRALRAARQYHDILKAKPGEREAKGWV